MADQKKKKSFFLFRWLKRGVAGNDGEIRDILREEQVQTPFKTMAKAFFHKRTAMVGVVVFLIIFVVVIVGPYIWKLDLTIRTAR